MSIGLCELLLLGLLSFVGIGIAIAANLHYIRRFMKHYKYAIHGAVLVVLLGITTMTANIKVADCGEGYIAFFPTIAKEVTILVLGECPCGCGGK